MWRFFAVMGVLCLGGCSLSGVIGHNSVDYNDTIEYVTNNMLITNTLRARDEVPLHFTDLSQIHGVVQVGVSAQVAAPFANASVANQKTRDIFTGIVSAASNPTFDIAPLNNTMFATGLLRPLDLAVLQDYIEQGVSQSLLLKLLISKIEFVLPGPPVAICTYNNSPLINPVRQDPDAPAPPPGPCPPAGLDRSIQTFGDLMQRMTAPVIVHTYQRLRPYGPPFVVEARNEVRNLGAAGVSPLMLRAVRGHSGEYQFYKSSTETALCLPLLENALRDQEPAYVAAGEAPSAGCYESEVTQADGQPGGLHVRIYLRSVQGIFEYLGTVLRLEKRNEQLRLAGKPALPLPDQLNFFVQPGQTIDARLNLTYNGAQYHVDDPSPRDNTLRVLQIVNQLLDTLKNASEIPTTRAVDVLP